MSILSPTIHRIGPGRPPLLAIFSHKRPTQSPPLYYLPRPGVRDLWTNRVTLKAEREGSKGLTLDSKLPLGGLLKDQITRDIDGH